MFFIFLVGCGRHSNPAYPYPSKVTWHGTDYKTSTKITKVGKKLGTVKDNELHKNYNIYKVPSYSPDKEIAVEIDNPNTKYVRAIPTKKSR
jgi:hypothetical protein